ncbi:hypothetical protein ACFQ7F_13100 [Streptomyces sp. NPDC056486]|uniref:hypothetical protein n=1 Tax=Streptomyces sp. NPDC056486 TaxID=3345835 RepID=UPI0036C36EB0
MMTAKRPKTKAAKDVHDGDWLVMGKLAWRVSEQWEADGFVFILWPNMSISDHRPDERLTIHYDD